MNEIMQTVLAISVIIIATEVICRLCPKNSMVGFIRALIITVMLINAVLSAARMEFTFSFDEGLQALQGDALNDYLDEQYQNAAANEMRSYVKGLLDTVDIDTKKIEISTDKNEAGSIIIEEITVVTTYESDRERALMLLKNTIGTEIMLEVQANG